MINHSILIVEDELGVAHPLKKALDLSPNKLYQVELSSSGEEALDRLKDKHFDLLISDFRLPGMDGLVLLEQAQRISPGILSVLITAYGSPAVEERAKKLAKAYIPKPFHLRDIILTVQGILEEASSAQQNVSHKRQTFSGLASRAKVERRRTTHLRVLACDMDGTLAKDGVIPPETWDLLNQLKLSGLSLILATGRVIESFIDSGPFVEFFDAIVAEDGAVVLFPKKNIAKLPFGRLSSTVVQRLEELKIPLERGMSIVATRVPYDEVILKVLQDINVGVTIEYNNGAVMLLPPGATKGTGLAYALQDLGYSPRNLVACGDAENDSSLLELAELAVAVPNAIPKIKALADVVLPQDPEDTGTGINMLLKQLLSRRGPPHRQRPERRLVLGYTKESAPVYLDPLTLVDSRLGIFGASNSGKSWVAGLLTEELFRLGYQVCIIDPEGDYRAMASMTHSLHMGITESPLPAVSDLINLLEWHSVSLVLDLSTRTPEERYAYVLDFARALRGLRTKRGRPHWFLIDEAQSFCPREGGELTDLLLESMQDGLGVGLVSYRPSQLSEALLKKLDHCLLTRLGIPEEIQALEPYLAQFDEGRDVLDQLPGLPVGQIFLCSNLYRPLTSKLQSPVRFQTGPRSIPHIRHLQKYLRAPLPENKRFYFCASTGRNLGYSAANLWEFRQIISSVSLDSVLYHQKRGDFGMWLQDVLGDGELAREVHKLNHRELSGEDLRQALLEMIINRYDELEEIM
jgi:hydroxymethylpyrimidine pyrophosphatase-like HAD family hydrolase/CheY-like chemotaxis protein